MPANDTGSIDISILDLNLVAIVSKWKHHYKATLIKLCHLRVYPIGP
jgi:hypothetical protein